MDLKGYSGRITHFQIVFMSLAHCTDAPASVSKGLRDKIATYFRNLMVKTEHGFQYEYSLNDYLQTHELKTFLEVDLLANIETLTQQVENLKSEIISISKALKEKYSTIAEANNNYVLLDFIRTTDGKIVYPFNYWEDCVEVYIRKNLFGHSNRKIVAEYKFKTSVSTATRAQQKLVADMLTEIGYLQEAIRNRVFPPRVLYGSKQPRMKE